MFVSIYLLVYLFLCACVTSFHGFAPLYPWYAPYNAVLSKEASSTMFLVFGMTRPEFETRSAGPLAKTLINMIISIYLYIDIYLDLTVV